MAPFDRFLFALTQGVRSAWFSGHYAIAMRRAPKIGVPPSGPLPSWKDIRADLEDLFRRDWHNVDAGLYPAPSLFGDGPFAALDRSIAFLRDLDSVNRRRRDGDAQEIYRDASTGSFPRYYLQNFHFQSGGYLTGESARLYDHQVETLFTGGADAMRRHALAHILRPLRNNRRGQPHHLDVGCGTGRLLAFLKASLPRLRVTGFDLSPAYLGEAARRLRPWSRTHLVSGKAEALPWADATFGSLSCLFLFHELPRAVRLQVAGEMARVLRPGGTLVFLDSIQLGDYAPYDALLDRFPLAFHEPYYADYIRQDLSRLFAECGLTVLRSERAFFAKSIVLRRE